MKRETRRLDDLLTIREGEVALMRERLQEEAERRGRVEEEARARVIRVERECQRQVAKVREEAAAKVNSTASTGGKVTKTHTSGKRSSAMQDTMVINETAPLHTHQLSTSVPQAFFGSATIDLNHLMSRQTCM